MNVIYQYRRHERDWPSRISQRSADVNCLNLSHISPLCWSHCPTAHCYVPKGRPSQQCAEPLVRRTSHQCASIGRRGAETAPAATMFDGPRSPCGGGSQTRPLSQRTLPLTLAKTFDLCITNSQLPPVHMHILPMLLSSCLKQKKTRPQGTSLIVVPPRFAATRYNCASAFAIDNGIARWVLLSTEGRFLPNASECLRASLVCRLPTRRLLAGHECPCATWLCVQV